MFLLNNKLTMLLGGIILFFSLIFTIFSHHYAHNLIITQTEQELLFISKEISKNISSRLSSEMKYIEILANKKIITDDTPWEEKVRILETEAKRLNFDSFGFIDLQGNAFRFNEEKSKTQVADREYFQRAIKGENVFSDVIINRITGKPIIMLITPVKKDDELIALFYGVKDASFLSKMVSEITYGETGFAYIVNEEITMIGHPNYDMVLTAFNPIKQQKENPELQPLADIARATLSMQEGILEYNFQNRDMLMGFTSIENTAGWRVALTIEKKEKLSKLIKLQNMTLSLTLFFLSLGIIIAILVANYTSQGKKRSQKLSLSNEELSATKQQLSSHEEYIRHLAYHDPLTNLPNRRMFMQKLESELANGRTGVVLLLDLDNFKRINNTKGHVYGDLVLQAVSQRLVKNNDAEKVFISRFGGDEFLLLIINEENFLNIEIYVKEILALFKEAFIIQENKIYINCSMGATLYPDDSTDPHILIMNTDTAMYQVKEAGKNNFIFFNSHMTEELNKNQEIETLLRTALQKDGLKLVYQPFIKVSTGEITGFEALLRLKNSTLSPAQFIPIAEETGLIIEIGKWVSKEAIEQIAKWKEKGFTIKPIAINFSSKQLKDEKYIDFIESTLKENLIEAKYLEIEITENIMLEKSVETLSFIYKLKNLGLKIVLDDFGTGYSSLSYLSFIPVDKIKLDKSLNDRFLKAEKVGVINSLLSLAKSLKLEVTAEGIEKKEQFKMLKEGKCDYIQGYFFSKPLEVWELEKIYNKNFLSDLK